MFSFVGEFLVDLDRFFDHSFVSFLATAKQHKVVDRGDSFVAVRIRSHSQQHWFERAFALFWAIVTCGQVNLRKAKRNEFFLCFGFVARRNAVQRNKNARR